MPSQHTSLAGHLRQEGHLNWGQFATSFMWPPAQLGDFVLGVVASQIARQLDGGDHLGLLGDLALVAWAAVVVMLPSPKSRAECQTDGNALLSHGGALAIAVFMCFGRFKGSVLGRVLSHPAVVALGKYSFEVYLFQWPLQAIFRQWQRWPENETFMAFLLLLRLVVVSKIVFVFSHGDSYQDWLNVFLPN